ncbi:MAG: amidohydrolase [bacterium]
MPKAELVFVNGNVITVDDAQPKAQAVAVRDGKIIAVGDNAAADECINPATEVIDLKGKTLLPGFNDSHLHLIFTGVNQMQVNPGGCRSIAEMSELVREKAATEPPGQWIVGHGWDQNLFREGRFPARYDLDLVAPHHPVAIARTCGHVIVVNSRALEIAGITKETPNPAGGEIERDPETGEPTGLLRENAGKLVSRFYSPWSYDLAKKALRLASAQAIAAGLTSVTTDDARFIGGYRDCLRLYREFWDSGTPMVRTYQLIAVNELDALLADGLKTGHGDDKVKVGAIKIFQDGGLGGRTAWLREPYDSAPDTCGVPIYPQPDLDNLLAGVHGAGMQAAIHAIGDAAVDSCLEAIGKAQAAAPRPDPRHRIVHYDILDEGILRRSVELGIVADIQPLFVAMNGKYVVSHLGEARAKLTYPWRTIVGRDIPCGGGSDSPVVSFNPLTGIWSAVTRHADYSKESEAFLPGEKLTVMEAIKLYTAGSAYTTFEEGSKGTLTPGKLADMVVLGADPLRILPDEIRDIPVEMTVIDGKVVYTAE